MCIGIPMQVRESGFGYALCEGMGQQREVDTLLVGEQPPGTWLLIFLNSAREVLSAEDAARIGDALSALNLVMDQPKLSGTAARAATSIDSLFADLVDREPPKPASLLALEATQSDDASLKHPVENTLED